MINQIHRQTGRTFRFILEALYYASLGKTVFFCCHNESQKNKCMKFSEEMAGVYLTDNSYRTVKSNSSVEVAEGVIFFKRGIVDNLSIISLKAHILFLI